MSENNIIDKKEILYSHAGKVSTEKLSYLLDRKSHIDKILAGKKRTKIVETDFINKEESYDDFDNQINDIEQEDIFTNEYEIKHISDLNEQKLKYFSNVKNPCTYIESKIKSKSKNKDKNKKQEIKEKPISNETKAKEELKKLIHSSNKFNYYYHLLHHTDNSNYFSEEKDDMFIFGPEVNATRYNPKLEYIYKKLIYSPSFKLMCGRYDQQIISKNVKNKIEKEKIKKREIERIKRIQKIRELVNSKLDTIYKYPTFYNEKNNDFIKYNEKIREIKKLKRSQSLIEEKPAIKDKLLGDVEMEKQLQRGVIPEHHDVRIRGEKAFHSQFDNKTIEQLENNSNSFKGSVICDNNTIINEQSLSNNKNNSNYNNNSSINNNNETIYTSNALKNELATLYNTNSNINESNNNSNLNLEKYQIKNTANNIELNNKYLTMRINNYKDNNRNMKNQTFYEKNFGKLNFFKRKKFPNIKDPRKTMYTSSTSNMFNYDNINKTSMRMNRTTANKLFSKKDSIKNESYINNINSPLININQNSKKGISFDKMLSRQYLDNLNYEEEPLHPQVNPKYNFIHPKCIMKVVYSNRSYNYKNIRKFEGLGEEVTFDADKLFYKYNDHFPTKSFYFKKMTGRLNSYDGYLPSFMVNLGNRNSCICFNDKSLKLNNFAEGNLKEQRSSFNQHKSFNWKLNMNLINLKEINKMKDEKSDINKLYKKIKDSNSIRNIRKKKKVIPGQPFLSVSLKTPSNNSLPEFYRVNLDLIERNKEYFKNKIDGITLKANVRSNNCKNLLSDKEKKLFFVNSSKNNRFELNI